MSFIEIRTEMFGEAISHFRPSSENRGVTLKRKRELIIASDMIGEIRIPLFPKKHTLFMSRGHF